MKNLRNKLMAWAMPKVLALYSGEKGALNTSAILAVIILIVLAPIGYVILTTMFAGPMSTGNATVQALTATDAGTVTGKSIMGMLFWVIAIGLGIALLVTVLRHALQGKD
jgi:hypothetical protein